MTKWILGLGIPIALAAGGSILISEQKIDETTIAQETYCLAILIDAPNVGDLRKSQTTLDKLKTLITKTTNDKDTDKERTFFTIKNATGKDAIVKTFYAVSGRTNPQIKDAFFPFITEYANSFGGLEFKKNEDSAYMAKRLKQLINEQGNCQKIYEFNLTDELPSTIINKFNEK